MICCAVRTPAQRLSTDQRHAMKHRDPAKSTFTGAFRLRQLGSTTTGCQASP